MLRVQVNTISKVLSTQVLGIEDTITTRIEVKAIIVAKFTVGRKVISLIKVIYLVTLF